MPSSEGIRFRNHQVLVEGSLFSIDGNADGGFYMHANNVAQIHFYRLAQSYLAFCLPISERQTPIIYSGTRFPGGRYVDLVLKMHAQT